MHQTLLPQHEAVAEYSQKQMLELTHTAHEQALQLLDAICAEIKPGMSEAEAQSAAEAIFQQNGIEKHWHRPYIYFGKHSIITAYDSKPKDILTLGAEDIACIDIGPIIKANGIEIEGDVGRTLVFGDNPIMRQLQEASQSLFEKAVQFWKTEQPTGIALYEQICQWTEALGFRFHLEPAGHLIGAFPHTGWKKGLSHYPHTAEPGIWILEIQLRHPELDYGAFYEAVLV